MEAVDFSRYDLSLHVKYGGDKREIEQRLLPVAERIQPALMPVRSLFEDHRDLADHLLESAADQAQSRFGVDLSSWSDDQRF